MQSKTMKKILIVALSVSMILGNSSMLAFAADEISDEQVISARNVEESIIEQHEMSQDAAAADAIQENEIIPAEEPAQEEAKPVECIEISTPEEYAETVGAAETGNTETVEINTATGDVVTESGEDVTMTEVLNLDEEEAEELTSGTASENQEAIEEYMDEKGVYSYEEEGTNLEVSFPYAYKMLMLVTAEGNLTDSHNATTVVYNKMLNQYVLVYETEEATKEAHDLLAKEFGEENVIISLPLNLMYNQTKTTYTSAESASWGVDYMGLDSLRDYANANPTGKKLTVAILDSGINKSKALFKGRTITSDSTSFVGNVTSNYDYFDDTLTSCPYYGHGTHVAGIIADGTSNEVELMIVKVIDSKGAGSLGTMLNAVVYAAEQGADVINLSLGANLGADSEYIINALDSYLEEATNLGVTIVASAGNDKLDIDVENTYPACSEFTHCVSSLKYSSISGVIYDSGYSNYGASVEYSAPGTSIISSYVGSDAEYTSMSGTSMAAPHMTAAFAMLKAYNRDATEAELTSLMDSFAVDKGDAGRDSKFGKGSVVFSSVNKVINTPGSGGNLPGTTEPEESGTPEAGGGSPSGTGGGSGESAGGTTNPGDNNTGATDKPGESGSTGDAGGEGTNPGTPSDGGQGGSTDNPGGSGESGTNPVQPGNPDQPDQQDEPEEPQIKEIKPSIKLSGTSYKYAAKVIKPSVTVRDEEGNILDSSNYTVAYSGSCKSVGKYTVKVTMCGEYSGTASASFKIIPKNTSFKLKSKTRKGFAVSWSKMTTKMASSRITGYQIQVCKKKSFSGAKTYKIKGYSKTSYKLKSLKKKTKYYVRIRTYMTTGGSTYYSSWSSAKSITTKK